MAYGPNGLREYGHIILLSVHRNYWGGSIGIKLYHHAEKYLLECGCRGIEFETNSKRTRLLNKLGFKVESYNAQGEPLFRKFF